MGRVAGAFGVRGWVRVVPFTEDPLTLLGHPAWWLKGRQSWASHRVVEAREHGGALVALLDGVADRDAAERLKGAEVGLPREALPAPAEDEVYWADLPGLAVVDPRGERLGQVVDVQENGAHGLLRVRRDDGGPDRLIPFVPAIVRSVDLESGRIEADWQPDW